MMVLAGDISALGNPRSQLAVWQMGLVIGQKAREGDKKVVTLMSHGLDLSTLI